LMMVVGCEEQHDLVALESLATNQYYERMAEEEWVCGRLLLRFVKYW